MRTVLVRHPGRLTDEAYWRAVQDERTRRHRQLGLPAPPSPKPVRAQRPRRPESIADPLPELTPECIVIGEDTRTDLPVPLSSRARLSGLTVIGTMGSGKSSLFESGSVQDMNADNGLAVFDPHGDLIDHVLPQTPTWREHDVRLIDLHDTSRPIGINPFGCRNPRDPLARAETHQRLMRVFTRTWPDLGIYARELLSRTTAVFIDNPGCSLGDVPRMLDDADFRRRVVANTSSPEVRNYWQRTYGGMSDSQRRAYANSTRDKVERFLDLDLSRHIFGQHRTTFDLDDILANGRILLIKLDPMLDELTTMIGALLIELIADAAFRREEGDRRPFFVWVDECQRFATSHIDRIVPQIRKFGVGFALAFQWRGLLSSNPSLREAVSAMPNKVVFNVTSEDARTLVDEFSADPAPQKQVVLDPLGQLEREGHANRDIHALVRQLRRQMVEERARIERRVEAGRGRYQKSAVAPDLPPLSAATEFATLRAAINDYLVGAMTDDEVVDEAPGSPALAWIVEELANLLALQPLERPIGEQVATRAGRRSELQADLCRQDPFHARCVVLTGTGGNRQTTREFSLRTPPYRPLDMSPNAQQRVVRIKSYSSQLCGTPFDVVEAEERKRDPGSSTEKRKSRGLPPPSDRVARGAMATEVNGPLEFEEDESDPIVPEVIVNDDE
jgi:Type IV secretion-system coupling protein DNA-binding domain